MSAASFSGPTATSGRPAAAAASNAASGSFRSWIAPTKSARVASLLGWKIGSTPSGVTTTFSDGTR